MSITAVILSGGSGTRLWPLSDESKPKQFLNLVGEQSMLQQTVARMRPPLFNPKTVFLSNTSQCDFISQQMQGTEYLIIAEPSRRNTAAAATAAALYVAEQEGDDLMLLAPADHVITKPGAFQEAVVKAVDAAKNGFIVTFGIRPEGPETGFGYIKRGAPLSDGIFAIETFKEKPDLITAREYCASGLFDWNAGIFLFSAKLFLDEVKRFHPDILDAVTKSYGTSHRSSSLIQLEEEAFNTSPSISIDFAVMEKTSKAAVVPCDIGWSDLGSYRSLYDIREKMDIARYPENSNLVNAKDCLVVTDGPQVNIVGLENIGVIVDEGRILVLNLDASQDVKILAETNKK